MYHTEGFLDDSTYFTKGHIWSFQIAQGRSLCYFWCVLKEEVKEEGGALAERLGRWLTQELVPCLEKGMVAIQKELNHFGDQLDACRQSYGLKERPMLHLYLQGKLYHYGMEQRGLKQQIRYFLAEEHRSQMSHRCAGQGFGIYMAADVREHLLAEGLLENMSLQVIEVVANRLKADVLKAQSTGSLQWGYFLMWEDNYDF